VLKASVDEAVAPTAGFVRIDGATTENSGTAEIAK